jgi:hypothetical protein
METRNLRPLMLAAILLMTLDALGQPALLLAYQLSPDFYVRHALAIVPSYPEIEAAMAILSLLSTITFCWWLLRAGSNLIALGYEDLEFTPASRIWWFLIPFACLYKPYQGMRELWNASHGNSDYADTSAFIAIWWAIWLATGFLGLILVIFAGGAEPTTQMWLSSAVGIALAAAGVRLLWGITTAQELQRRVVVAEVFA